jgi:hypothetical protein
LENETVISPFPVARERVRTASMIRSTWLSSSIHAVQKRGLTDRYLAALPREHHDAVLSSVAGVWLPVAVGVAHYDAMDSLRLNPLEVVAIGKETSAWLHTTVLAIATTFARGIGVTPAAVLGQLSRFWSKSMVGGGVGAFLTGPKDARVEFLGFPCARIPYVRLAVRGVIQGALENFAQVVYVREIPELCGSLTLGYRVSWV